MGIVGIEDALICCTKLNAKRTSFHRTYGTSPVKQLVSLVFDLPVFVLPLVLRATIFYIWVCLKVNSPTAEDVHHVSNENGRVGVPNKSILAENLENSDYFGIDTPYNFHHSSDSQ